MKRRGPRAEPWEMLVVTGVSCDRKSLLQLERYDLNPARGVPVKPSEASLSRRVM